MPISWSAGHARALSHHGGWVQAPRGWGSGHTCGPHLLTRIHLQLRSQHTKGGRGFLSQESGQIVRLKQRFWGREAGKRVQAEGRGPAVGKCPGSRYS